MFRVAMVAAMFAAFPAMAQKASSCVDRSDFLKHLSSNYSEAPIAMGLTASGKVLEVVASKSGTWTIIVTLPSGLTCGVAAGESWEKLGPLGGKGPKT